jgi:hypothetical protein
MSQSGPSLVEQAASVHRLLNLAPMPALSEREMLEVLLPLANESATDEQKARAMFATSLSHSLPAKTAAQYAKLQGSEFFRKPWASVTKERDWFHSQVTEILQDRDSARKKLRADVTAAFGDVVLIPMVKLEDWSITYELRYYALNMRAMCAFALALLLDESKGFGAALKTCKLSNCPNLFLSLPTSKGGRPPLYCSTDHQTEFANEGSARRTAAWRERKGARKPK